MHLIPIISQENQNERIIVILTPEYNIELEQITYHTVDFH